MIRHTRPWVAAVLPTLLWLCATVRADAQTLKLTVHGGGVRVVSGAVGASISLNPDRTFYVNTGATVRLAVDYPGQFSAGTGPAAVCALSTCSFTMTADADITVISAGSAPTATLTTTRAGDGGGVIRADGVACPSGSCTVTYLQGSMIELGAEAGAAAGFVGYSAGTGPASVCGGAATCSFTLNGDASVTGTFLALTSFTVTPSTAFGMPGGPAQMFTATGTYSGGASGVIPSGKGEWSAAPSLPTRIDNLAAAALSGKVYAIGGRPISFDASSITNAVKVFDPVAQTWTSRAPMLVNRASLGATTAGGLLYAIGGINSPQLGVAGTPLASVERYDPGTDTWTMRASMSVAREGLVAGTVNGIIYAAGGRNTGGSPVATLEAYDPATDTWTVKAPMATARSFVAGGVIDGSLYVAGGYDGTSPVSTVEAYEPATNTWTAKAPMPVPLSGAAAAVADGVLYVMAGNFYAQSALYAYDAVTDSWSVKAPMRTPRSDVAAASLNGTIYAIGGDDVAFLFCCNKTADTVQTYVDSLRWSSSAPSVARIAQTGAAAPLAPGTATIVANVGGTTCGASCPILVVPGPTTMSLDAPANNTSVTAGTTLTIGGWALNTAAPTGTGVDTIHVYAIPASGPAIFLGIPAYGQPRPDVGAIFGAQFTNSGFTLMAGSALPVGDYTIVAFGHNALTLQFDVAKSAAIHVTAGFSNGFIAIDTPQPSQVVTSAFEIGGWAVDMAAPTGTGVDAVQFYVFPNGGASPGVFVGQGSYGSARPDVGAIFGSRFTDSGYHFTITGLGPGAYLLGVFAHSTVTNSYSVVKMQPFTVNATALMSIDAPGAEATIAAPVFIVGGWSIDRSIESTGLSGTGVDQLHIYAIPNPGSGTPAIFLGVATPGVSRPDVGALYGARYNDSGYNLVVDRAASGLAPGVYSIAVVSHSTVSGTFNNLAVVRVTLQ